MAFQIMEFPCGMMESYGHSVPYPEKVRFFLEINIRSWGNFH